jgi:hypothetical protein
MTVDINSVVDSYMKAVKESVDVYGALAKNAGARLTAAPKQPASSWTDDAVTFWKTAAADLATLVATQQQFAAEAAKTPEPTAAAPKKAAGPTKKAAKKAPQK